MRFWFLGLCSDQEGWDREWQATIGGGEEEEGVLHNEFVKLGRLVRKLDLSHLCFSLNFYFLMFLRNFLLCFPY